MRRTTVGGSVGRAVRGGGTCGVAALAVLTLALAGCSSTPTPEPIGTTGAATTTGAPATASVGGAATGPATSTAATTAAPTTTTTPTVVPTGPATEIAPKPPVPVTPRASYGRPAAGDTTQAAGPRVLAFLAAAERAYAKADMAGSGVDEYAKDSALDEVSAAVADLKANAVTLRGKILATQLSVFTTAAPDTVLAVACLDSSGVAVVDSSGRITRPTVAAGTRRDLHQYTLTQSGGAWWVVKHDLSANTTCSGTGG